MNMNLTELSVEDFLDWFNELSTPGPGDGTIAAAGVLERGKLIKFCAFEYSSAPSEVAGK